MAINVLVVIDGDFQFDSNPSAPDFTFKTLVGTLTDAGFQVTLASRENVTDGSGAIANFNFATSVDLLDFDMIWMLGDGGVNDAGGAQAGKGPLDTTNLHPNAVPAEKNAIANFMEQGGGVFAVGDHFDLGSDMCGLLPRVRVMRSWFANYDPVANGGATPPELSQVPGNYPSITAARADTTLRNPSGTYPATDSAGHAITHSYAYFQNQSDPLPQTIAPVPPVHPILQNNGATVTLYPDHMHEGTTWATVPGFDYVHQLSPYGDTSKPEFRSVGADHPTPQVIATGHANAQGSYYVGNDSAATHMAPIAIVGDTVSGTPTVNTLTVYDGRIAGVGRIVTGSTFHHYIDINLIGTSYVTDPTINVYIGGNAGPGQGLSANPQAFAGIKAVYVNITTWLARPKPAIGLILERSTFGQSEVSAMPGFAAAVLVTVDGVKPSQFPGGGIDTLTPTAAQLAQWAPAVSVGGAPITLTPTGIASDDPGLGDRLQRLTFTYRLDFVGDAFTFGGATETVAIDAVLTTSAAPAPLTDQAWIELVKSANPFMLDLADGNATAWLSSDIKVFHVVAGETFLGHGLPAGASRTQALAYLQDVLSNIDSASFTNLDPTEDGARSVLSATAVTTSNKPVYNFALARVRISSAGGDADPVQVFFRSFVSQTTAALTYQLDSGQNPLGGYVQTSGAPAVPLPGTQAGGSQWLSFPFFAATRAATPAAQTDPKNAKPVLASAGVQFYGALIDNNLDGAYLTETPVSGGAAQSLPTLLMGEHQCIVTEVVYGGSPIPSGANPATSDKIAQRNLAISTVANPGLSASRVAMHSFEIEATPGAITPALPPDELLLAWPRPVPRGTYVSLHVPSWSAQEVVDLADRLYARHELRAIDAHTIEIPGGGDRYVPIPRSALRQNGVVSVALPLGIREGQRYDLSIQHITNRQRTVGQPVPKVETITLREAAALLQKDRPGLRKTRGDKAAAGTIERGVFDLGDGRSLVTDLAVFDGGGDHALIVTHPDPGKVAAARASARAWREPIGTFQLGIPVSTRQAMLLYHLQLLSIMLWRFEHLDRRSPWYASMAYYLRLLTDKILALGGDPYGVPPTPGGHIPQLGGDGGHGIPPGEGEADGDDEPCDDGPHDDGPCDDGPACVTVNIYAGGRPRRPPAKIDRRPRN